MLTKGVSIMVEKIAVRPGDLGVETGQHPKLILPPPKNYGTDIEMIVDERNGRISCDEGEDNSHPAYVPNQHLCG